MHREGRWHGRHRSGQDAAVVVIPTLLHLLQVRSGPPLVEGPGAAGSLVVLVLALGQGLPLLWRRRHPLGAAGACLLATSTSLLLVPVPPYAAVVATYAVAAYDRGNRWRAAAAGAALLGVLAAAAVWWGQEAPWLSTAASVTLVAVLAGALSRVRRAEVEALRDRADALERERDAATARAVAEERLRVARDLHDLVGHGLSAIAVQASTARLALRLGAVDTATDALTAVEAVTRESLTEMRQVLGVLRAPDADPAPPAPGLQDVGALVAHTAAAGCVISTEITGDVSRVPASVSLAAYRILQESLTNVVKHAARATVTVRVAASPDAVDLVVEDVPVPVDPSSGPTVAVPVPRPAGGYGVVGMRERAAAFGGELVAGPVGGAGWRVTARVPVLRPQEPA
jgi:signal transduction histidine kinase